MTNLRGNYTLRNEYIGNQDEGFDLKEYDFFFNKLMNDKSLSLSEIKLCHEKNIYLRER